MLFHPYATIPGCHRSYTMSRYMNKFTLCSFQSFFCCQKLWTTQKLSLANFSNAGTKKAHQSRGSRRPRQSRLSPGTRNRPRARQAKTARRREKRELFLSSVENNRPDQSLHGYPSCRKRANVSEFPLDCTGPKASQPTLKAHKTLTHHSHTPLPGLPGL